MAKTPAPTTSAKKATIPFRQDSKEFATLVTLLKKGKVKPTDQPASVRSKYSQHFAKFTAAQFRAQYSKAKGLVAGNSKSDYFVVVDFISY